MIWAWLGGSVARVERFVPPLGAPTREARLWATRVGLGAFAEPETALLTLAVAVDDPCAGAFPADSCHVSLTPCEVRRKSRGP